MNTENWNCLMTDNNEEEIYRDYDEVISLVLTEIYQRSEEEGVIRLYRFNRKNLEHMCILRIALIARDLFHFSIEVDASWLDVFYLNWHLHKNFDKVKQYKLKMNVNDGKGINVLMLTDKYHAFIGTTGRDFSFADIYKAYYERSK
jgi:hypothetical protein